MILHSHVSPGQATLHPLCCPSPAESCVTQNRFLLVSELTGHLPSRPKKSPAPVPRLAQSPHLLSLGRRQKHPAPPTPMSRPGHSCSSDSHLEDIGLGTGWPGPGLLQLTGYFQRFGNRWHLASWLWGSGTWISEWADATWGLLSELGVRRRPPFRKETG